MSGGGMQGFGGQGGGFGGGMGFQQPASFSPRPSFGMPSGFSQPAQFNSVTDLYQNILNRAPDPEGMQYWQNRFGPTIDDNESYLFRQVAAPEVQARGVKYRPAFVNYNTSDPMSVSNYGATPPAPIGSGVTPAMPIVSRSSGLRSAPAIRRASGGIVSLINT